MNRTSFAEVQTHKLSWPTPQDYNEALQHPDTCFLDPELKAGQPKINMLGLPRPITGAFASVYQVDCGEKEYAVKCFLTNIADQEERYDKISKYLNKIALPIMADFDYLEPGILVHATSYPLLRMDWVDGQNLIEYIGRNLDNAPVLEKLRMWLRNARKSMSDNGIAHGDLQHGNILVTNSDIKLVDYDGMFVPELAGYESNELGHRNYQHPQRNKNDFASYLDNFSAWLIDTSLYCLEKDPLLWFDLNGGQECLLFREKDLKDPLSSFAFNHLESHSNQDVQARSKWLRWLLTQQVKKVPDLDADPNVPDTLPTLNPQAMKPDWLSSAEYLTAKPGEAQANKQTTNSYARQWLGINTKSATSTGNTWQNPGSLSAPSSPPVWDRYGSTSTTSSTGYNPWSYLFLLLFVIIRVVVGGHSSSHTSYAPPVGQPAPPSYSQKIQISQNKEAQTLIDEANGYSNHRNYYEALAIYQNAYAVLQKAGQDQSPQGATCLYLMGRMETQLGNYSEAYDYLDMAKTIFGRFGETMALSQVYHGFGMSFFKQNDFSAAVNMFQQSVSLLEQLPESAKRDNDIAYVSNDLLVSLADSKNYAKADSIGKRLIQYYDDQAGSAPSFAAPHLCNIANYFIQRKEFALAQQALDVAVKNYSPKSNPALAKEIRQLKLKLGNR